jgi:hypothetical protein
MRTGCLVNHTNMRPQSVWECYLSGHAMEGGIRGLPQQASKAADCVDCSTSSIQGCACTPTTNPHPLLTSVSPAGGISAEVRLPLTLLIIPAPYPLPLTLPIAPAPYPLPLALPTPAAEAAVGDPSRSIVRATAPARGVGGIRVAVDTRLPLLLSKLSAGEGGGAVDANDSCPANPIVAAVPGNGGDARGPAVGAATREGGSATGGPPITKGLLVFLGGATDPGLTGGTLPGERSIGGEGARGGRLIGRVLAAVAVGPAFMPLAPAAAAPANPALPVAPIPPPILRLPEKEPGLDTRGPPASL